MCLPPKNSGNVSRSLPNVERASTTRNTSRGGKGVKLFTNVTPNNSNVCKGFENSPYPSNWFLSESPFPAPYIRLVFENTGGFEYAGNLVLSEGGRSYTLYGSQGGEGYFIFPFRAFTLLVSGGFPLLPSDGYEFYFSLNVYYYDGITETLIYDRAGEYLNSGIPPFPVCAITY